MLLICHIDVEASFPYNSYDIDVCVCILFRAWNHSILLSSNTQKKNLICSLVCSNDRNSLNPDMRVYQSTDKDNPFTSQSPQHSESHDRLTLTFLLISLRMWQDKNYRQQIDDKNKLQLDSQTHSWITVKIKYCTVPLTENISVK